MRIETERLELSTVTPSDAELLLKLFTTPEVLRYLPTGPPWTIDRAKEAVERRMKLEAETSYSMLVVRKKETGEFIGNAGLQPVPNSSEVEIAYHYLPSSWGKGYATEAAIAVLSHGLGSVGLRAIIAVCMPENVASWRVMEKAGMRYLGVASYYGLNGLKKYGAERERWVSPRRNP
jgi:[ribosomal protein S5]-alanine N-acetyltransferase